MVSVDPSVSQAFQQTAIVVHNAFQNEKQSWSISYGKVIDAAGYEGLIIVWPSVQLGKIIIGLRNA